MAAWCETARSVITVPLIPSRNMRESFSAAQHLTRENSGTAPSITQTLRELRVRLQPPGSCTNVISVAFRMSADMTLTWCVGYIATNDKRPVNTLYSRNLKRQAGSADAHGLGRP